MSKRLKVITKLVKAQILATDFSSWGTILVDECPQDGATRSKIWTLSPIPESGERNVNADQNRNGNMSKNWKWFGNMVEMFEDHASMFKGERAALLRLNQYYQGASGVIAANNVFVHRAKSRFIDRLPLDKVNPNADASNGIGNSGFRRPQYHYRRGFYSLLCVLLQTSLIT